MPKLNVKLPNGSTQEVQIDSLTEGTVYDLKTVMAAAIDIPADFQRVVYKGRILKDADPLASVGLLDGVALHVVRSAGAPTPAAAASATSSSQHQQQQQQSQQAPPPPPPVSDNNNNTAAPANPFASLFGGAPQQQQQHQQNNNMQGGNPFGGGNPFAGLGGGGGLGGPGMMGGMGGGNNANQLAAAAQMMQSNPQMAAMMQQLMQNPQMMRQMMQMDPNINAMPEPQRSQMLDLLTNPIMLQGMMSAMQGGGGMGGMGMGGMGGMGMGGGGGNPFAQMMGGGNNNNQQQQQGGGGFQAPPAPQQPQQPQISNDEARARYGNQLQQLQTMGFPNEDANIRALIMTQGNVDFAVARLLGD